MTLVLLLTGIPYDDIGKLPLWLARDLAEVAMIRSGDPRAVAWIPDAAEYGVESARKARRQRSLY